MRSKRTSPQEQLRLIAECRQSGLTDHEWCRQHNIKVSTYYAWVHRLRRRGGMDISAATPRTAQRESEPPDTSKTILAAEPSAKSLPAAQTQASYPVMEFIMNDVHLRVTNDVSLSLLAEALRLLRDA